MKSSLKIIIILIVASFVGTIGEELVKEYSLQHHMESNIEKCVSEYGISREDCKNTLESVEGDLRKIQNQKGEQKEETSKEINKKALISSCIAQNQSAEYCECGWNKIIDKYTYDGYEHLRNKLSETGTEGFESDPELKEFINFMQNEIPKTCN